MKSSGLCLLTDPEAALDLPVVVWCLSPHTVGALFSGDGPSWGPRCPLRALVEAPTSSAAH